MYPNGEVSRTFLSSHEGLLADLVLDSLQELDVSPIRSDSVSHRVHTDSLGRGMTDYYSRYRPGLGSVITGLFIFSLFVQYLFLYLTARVQKMRISAFRHQALEAAWGPTKKPTAGQPQGKKKLKVKTGEQGDPLGIPGINGGKAIGAGSTIEMMIDNEKVYIVENKKGMKITLLSSLYFPTFPVLELIPTLIFRIIRVM